MYTHIHIYIHITSDYVLGSPGQPLPNGNAVARFGCFESYSKKRLLRVTGKRAPDLPAKTIPTKVRRLRTSSKFPLDMRIPPLWSSRNGACNKNEFCLSQALRSPESQHEESGGHPLGDSLRGDQGDWLRPISLLTLWISGGLTRAQSSF